MFDLSETELNEWISNISKNTTKSEQDKKKPQKKKETINPVINPIIELFVELHGMTKLGAKQCIINVFKSLNENNAYKIKFNVGVGNHSQDNETVLEKILKNVCDDFNYELRNEVDSKNTINRGRYVVEIAKIEKKQVKPIQNKSVPNRRPRNFFESH